MFLSDCFSGRTSDQYIDGQIRSIFRWSTTSSIYDSGFYKLLHPGDEVMADRGFQIKEDLLYYCSLNVLPEGTVKSQMTAAEWEKTKSVANLRIHVERASNRIDEFKILKNVSPINLQNVEHNHMKRITELYQMYDLTQLISEPTRETCYTSTLIDHIAASAASNIIKSGVLKVLLSDHYMIFCIWKYSGALKGQHKNIITHQITDLDWNSFLSDISSIDWDSILNCSKDINTAAENWSNILSMIKEKQAPLQ